MHPPLFSTQSNVYFTLQERIVQRQEDERNLKQSFIIQKEQELQHILRYNKLVMEEDAKRSNVEVYEQGEWALLLKQLRAWMVQWNAMQQAISLVVQEEELRRQKVLRAPCGACHSCPGLAHVALALN